MRARVDEEEEEVLLIVRPDTSWNLHIHVAGAHFLPKGLLEIEKKPWPVLQGRSSKTCLCVKRSSKVAETIPFIWLWVKTNGIPFWGR